MSCDLICVDPNDADAMMDAWLTVGTHIERAMTKTNMSDFAALEDEVLNGQALLWIAVDGDQIKAAAVTQAAISNGHKYCTIIACGGNGRRDWLSLISGLENYARREGCAAMRIFGRRGWSRVLPDYKIVGHITERKLQ